MKTWSIIVLSFFLQQTFAGTETHGGDARRFRVQMARVEILKGLKEFLEIKSNPDLRTFCEGAQNYDFSQLIETAPHIISAVPRSKTVWVESPQTSCLAVESNYSENILLLSYNQCPLPTPNNFYLDLIFKTLQNVGNIDSVVHRNGPVVDLSTLEAALSLVRNCRYLRGMHPIIPVSRPLEPDAFSNDLKFLMTLEKGRQIASQLLINLRPEVFQNFHEVIRLFLESNKTDLINDIYSTQYTIAHYQQTSCAKTELFRNRSIEFSPISCIDFQTELDVAWLILHETAHHFGIDAENFADLYAVEVIRNSYL